MAEIVLLMGKSGSGKSAGMRTCVNNPNFNVVNVLNKRYPFQGELNSGSSSDYNQVMKWLIQFPAQSIIVDDAGYLITNMFMEGHANAGAGNAVFSFYNKIGDHFWNFIQFIKEKVAADKIVYIIMHEDTDDFGNIRPKTIGKLLDEKVCIEGMFTIVLRSAVRNGKYVFLTQSTENDVAKSPIGMFENVEIPNDIAFVDKTIRAYYKMPDKNTEEGKKA